VSARRGWLAAVLLPALLCVGVLAAMPTAERGFPHQAHARLFPTCEGCHAGAVTGDAAALYPAAARCARCHDGGRAGRVAWQPPAPRASNLRFSHPEHREVAGDEAPADCQACHAIGDGPMAVGAAEPARCLACHAHAGDSHLAETVACVRCHLPLAEATTLPAARVAALPRPPSHETAGFEGSHGAAARTGASCAVCHARESCERCHANAEALPEITRLAPDPRIAALERGRVPRYGVPASHRGAWGEAHGAAATRQIASCANCHTRPSCTGCHQQGEPGAGAVAARAIAALPLPPGAAVRAAANGATAVHPPDFAGRHGGAAASGKLECASCHRAQQCADCHGGADARGFHPLNFMERHAAEVFAGTGSCQSCHSTETFCRDCHTGAGLGSGGHMSAAFHTGQPLWVLTHGQAARIGLESCASCHRQQDCMQCHSAAGGWGVSPHGPGFAAGRLSARNAEACRLCHFNNPVRSP
jgi:hypothetical protein